LIIPAASARFWTHRLRALLTLSGLFGALSGFLGSGISALMANLPAGAVIVLAASSFFVVSMIFGSARGLLHLGLDRLRLRRKIMNENLLRDLHEWRETSADGDNRVPRAGALMLRRAWTPGNLKRTLRRLNRQGLIHQPNDGTIRLSENGKAAAREIVLRHRLWETYLITHADVAPGMVDLSADRIEHVLDAELIQRLKNLMEKGRDSEPLPSPHRLNGIEGV
jgi:manganese/zinc/iron transport system permease protein